MAPSYVSNQGARPAAPGGGSTQPTLAAAALGVVPHGMYEVGIDINGATEGRTSPARMRRNARPYRRANEQRDVSQNAAYCTALHVAMRVALPDGRHRASRSSSRLRNIARVAMGHFQVTDRFPLGRLRMALRQQEQDGNVTKQAAR